MVAKKKTFSDVRKEAQDVEYALCAPSGEEAAETYGLEADYLALPSSAVSSSSLPVSTGYIPSPSEGSKYIHYVNALPYLTAEEEHELALSWYEHQDLEAAKKLVLAHLRAVVKVARDYNGYGIAQEDLIQEGNVGLMKAVRGFDPHVGVRLISYALLWIRAEIQEYILSNWRIVKIGSSKNLKKLFFNLRSVQEKLWGSSPLEQKEKIAQLLDVPVEDVESAWKWFAAEPMSLEGSAENDDSYDVKEGMGAFFLPDYQTPQSILEQKEQEILLPNVVQQSLATLEPREKSILEQRYLSEEKVSLAELSKEWGVSLERVRQIEVGALRKLKKHLESQRHVLVDYVTDKAQKVCPSKNKGRH